VNVLKWTALAAAAVVLTGAGSVYSASYRWAQASQQIDDLQHTTDAIETHVAKHDEQLDAIKRRDAAMQRSLDEIEDTVHEIQSEVRKPSHGDRK
jgi:septation ring formation regulator EzrA